MTVLVDIAVPSSLSTTKGMIGNGLLLNVRFVPVRLQEYNAFPSPTPGLLKNCTPPKSNEVLLALAMTSLQKVALLVKSALKFQV